MNALHGFEIQFDASCSASCHVVTFPAHLFLVQTRTQLKQLISCMTYRTTGAIKRACMFDLQ
jgi:hypothetical protein